MKCGSKETMKPWQSNSQWLHYMETDWGWWREASASTSRPSFWTVRFEVLGKCGDEFLLFTLYKTLWIRTVRCMWMYCFFSISLFEGGHFTEGRITLRTYCSGEDEAGKWQPNRRNSGETPAMCRAVWTREVNSSNITARCMRVQVKFQNNVYTYRGQDMPQFENNHRGHMGFENQEVSPLNI